VRLERCRDFVRRLQRVVDGPIPCSVVNHVASISQWALGVRRVNPDLVFH
jgi:hypothetical protein